VNTQQPALEHNLATIPTNLPVAPCDFVSYITIQLLDDSPGGGPEPVLPVPPGSRL